MKFTVYTEDTKPIGRTMRAVCKHLYSNPPKGIKWRRYPNSDAFKIEQIPLPKSIRNSLDKLATKHLDTPMPDAHRYLFERLRDEGLIKIIGNGDKCPETEPFMVLLKDRSNPIEKMNIRGFFARNNGMIVVLINERNAIEEDRKIDIL